MIMRCDWPVCRHERFSSHDSLIAHSAHHREEILQQWSGSKKCNWPGCKSQRTIFKNLSTLRKHLRAHIKTFFCDVDTCSYVGAFGKQHDLDRHKKTAHSEASFFCHVEACERHSVGYTRKDKLNEHVRNEHGAFRCGFDHCNAIVLPNEQQIHIAQSHQGDGDPNTKDPSQLGFYIGGNRSIYECNLAGCAGTTSRFCYRGLVKHLKVDHSVPEHHTRHIWRYNSNFDHQTSDYTTGPWPTKTIYKLSWTSNQRLENTPKACGTCSGNSQPSA